MKFFAFQVAYLGRNYLGYQRQPNGQTVENHLEFAFIMSDLIYSFKENQYKGSSRTDQGVNAKGNVFVLACLSEPNLPQINSYLPDDILIWAYSNISKEFNPRHKVVKTYRYYLSHHLVPSLTDITRIYQFQGKHNFSPFLKKHGAGKFNPITDITSVTIKKLDRMFIIDIIGDNFGREQIRQMIGFLLEERHAKISPIEVLENQINLDIKSAPPENLVLMSISYIPSISWLSNKRIFDFLQLLMDKIISNYERFSALQNFTSELYNDLFQITNVGQ